MILLMILMSIFGLGRCLDQLPTTFEIESSINRTIEQVERMIDQNSKLPKLSRKQIVDILFNITTHDIESMEESVRKARSDYQRALMVVLPYNSKDAKNQDIKDLYTKPPMVQVIPDSGSMLPFSSIHEESPGSDPVFDNLINTRYVEEINNEFGSMQEGHGKADSEPERFSLISNWDIPASKLSESEKMNKSSNGKQKLDIVYSTGGTEKPTTRMLKTTSEPISSFRPTMPTTKSTVNVLTSDQWKYFAPPVTPKATTTSTTTTTTTTTTQRPTTTTQISTTTTTKQPPVITTKESHKIWDWSKPEPFFPTVLSSSLTDGQVPSAVPPFKKLPQTTVKPEIVTFDMMDYEMMNDEPQPMVFVTPMSSTSTLKNKKKFSASFSTEMEDDSEAKTPVPMRKEVMTLLKSIGLDATETKSNKVENSNSASGQGIFSTNFEIPESDNILPSHMSALSSTGVDSPSITNQNTFEETPKDVRQGFNNLTPDVQWLFQRFGLEVLKEPEKPTTTTTKAPVLSTFRSWNNFKPLPTSHVQDESMRDFLAKFGLGVDNRNGKSMKFDKTLETSTSSVIEAVPDNMRDILANIGLIERKYVPEKVKVSARSNSDISPSKLHIFKPHEIQLNDQRQKIKINQLLDTVKLAQEGKAQVSDVRKAANELLETAKTLKEGPDPLNLEELMRMYSNDVRNEVKRQNNDENSSKSEGIPDTEEDSTSATTTTTTTTEMTTGARGTNSSEIPVDSELSADSVGTSSDSETKVVDSQTTTTTQLPPLTETSNIDDLEDSFGGVTESPDPALPAPRKTGLYFLLDWNSFLEVGEEDKDKVNLRFSPKVGDRTQFIPVVIP